MRWEFVCQLIAHHKHAWAEHMVYGTATHIILMAHLTWINGKFRRTSIPGRRWKRIFSTHIRPGLGDLRNMPRKTENLHSFFLSAHWGLLTLPSVRNVFMVDFWNQFHFEMIENTNPWRGHLCVIWCYHICSEYIFVVIKRRKREENRESEMEICLLKFLVEFRMEVGFARERQRRTSRHW